MKYPAFILILTLCCVESISFEKKLSFQKKKFWMKLKKYKRKKLKYD